MQRIIFRNSTLHMTKSAAKRIETEITVAGERTSMGWIINLPGCAHSQLVAAGLFNQVAPQSYTFVCTSPGNELTLTFQDNASYQQFAHNFTHGAMPGYLLDANSNPNDNLSQLYLSNHDYSNLLHQLSLPPALLSLNPNQLNAVELASGATGVSHESDGGAAQIAHWIAHSAYKVWDRDGNLNTMSDAFMLQINSYREVVHQLDSSHQSITVQPAPEPHTPDASLQASDIAAFLALLVSLLTLIIMPRLNARHRIREDQRFRASEESAELEQKKEERVRAAMLDYEKIPVEDLIRRYNLRDLVEVEAKRIQQEGIPATIDYYSEKDMALARILVGTAEKEGGTESTDEDKAARMHALAQQFAMARSLGQIDHHAAIYGRKSEIDTALANLLLEGKTGLAITGHAGVGKSTLLRAIARHLAQARDEGRRGEANAFSHVRLLKLNLAQHLAGASSQDIEFRLAPIRRIAQSDPENNKIVIEVPDNPEDIDRFRMTLDSLKEDIGEGKFGMILVMTHERYKELIKCNPQLARRITEQRIYELDAATIDIIIHNTANLQIKKLRESDLSLRSTPFKISENAIRRIRELAAVTPPFSQYADPDRSMDLVRRTIIHVYRQRQQQNVPIDIHGRDVLQFVRKQIRHPEVARTVEQIQLMIRKISTYLLSDNAEKALGVNFAQLEQRKDESLATYVWRLRHIQRVSHRLVQAIENVGTKREKIEKLISSLQEAFRSNGHVPSDSDFPVYGDSKK